MGIAEPKVLGLSLLHTIRNFLLGETGGSIYMFRKETG